MMSHLGDSNIRRKVDKNSCRASPHLKACQVLYSCNKESLPSSLGQVRSESSICLVSCISNFIADAEESNSLAHHVEPVLQEVRSALLAACTARPAMRFMLAPPMYQSIPLWYREGLPEILTLFSQVMTFERPHTLMLLSSFATPEFGPDGIHLTPYSGLEFLLHLFDGALELLETLSSGIEGVTSHTRESNRILEDRVVALEQDHRHLARAVDDKIAIDAELVDFAKNERFEDCFVIEGTARIPAKIFGKAWQDRAVRDVQQVLVLLMG